MTSRTPHQRAAYNELRHPKPQTHHVVVGPNPVGTRTHSCPITALAYAGFQAQLYKFEAEDFANAVDMDSSDHNSSSSDDEERDESMPSRAAMAAAERAREILHQLYRGPWGGDRRLPRYCEAIDFNEINMQAVGEAVDGVRVLLPHFLETPFRGTDTSSRATIEVRVIPNRPRNAAEVADLYTRLFCSTTISLIHGKGDGRHEIGELSDRATTRVRGAASSASTPLTRCDLCTMAGQLETAYEQATEHASDNIPTTDRRYVRMSQRNTRGSSASARTEKHILVKL